MVRPANFGMNPETAGTNAFQTKLQFEKEELVSQKAITEFDEMVTKLESSGVEVQVFQDSKSPVKPDVVFPNNWISTHENGEVVLYPMLAENRRLEFRPDVVDWLNPSNLIDFRDSQNQNTFLEGTGSIVLDNEAKIMYVGISPRTNLKLAKNLAQKLDFTICSFHPTDHQNNSIYHTNVIMFVMHGFVSIGLETIRDKTEREMVKRTILNSGKQILELDYYQITQFAGNMIQLRNNKNELVLVCSTTAWNSLKADQKELIENKTKVITVEIPTIEMYGGGSARCMIAEKFSD
jgi:hypothetical protein